MKRERFEQILPQERNKLQKHLDDVSQYALENEMKLNKEKTKVMLFNTASQRDFMPEVNVDGKQLEVVEEYKLLGVIISSNLKWEANTEYITKKAFSRLWMLRRLKNLGLKTHSLVKIFITQIRSVLEFGAVTWHSMITKENSRTIERVQKAALAIILGPDYIGYDYALSQTNLQRLDIRRTALSLSFAKKSAKHPLHKNWFCNQNENMKIKTRAAKPTFKPAKARTQRLMKSPIPYLTELLNNDAAKI